MCTFQKLEFTRILPRQNGIFAWARYDGWKHQFSFLIQPDGTVRGETQAVTGRSLLRNPQELLPQSSRRSYSAEKLEYLKTEIRAAVELLNERIRITFRGWWDSSRRSGPFFKKATQFISDEFIVPIRNLIRLKKLKKSTLRD